MKNLRGDYILKASHKDTRSQFIVMAGVLFMKLPRTWVDFSRNSLGTPTPVSQVYHMPWKALLEIEMNRFIRLRVPARNAFGVENPQ